MGGNIFPEFLFEIANPTATGYLGYRKGRIFKKMISRRRGSCQKSSMVPHALESWSPEEGLAFSSVGLQKYLFL